MSTAKSPGPRRLAVALAALWLLAACGARPTPAAGTPPPADASPPASTPAPAESDPAPTAVPAPSPTPAPAEMQLCLAAEPDSLYAYRAYEGRAAHLAAEHVRQALFDGPIDPVGFAHRPVLVTDLPTLENGGARIERVPVTTGERHYDAATGRVTEWRGGETTLEQLTMTYTLQPGVLWSDGEPLTADDSVFAFELLAGAGADPTMQPAELLRLAQRTSAYEALDDLTVRWTGLPGYLDREPLVTYSTFIAPLPRHQLGEVDPLRLAEHEQARRAPLGWGPFVMEAWEAGEAIRLRRNPAYFRAGEGLPRLETLVFRFVPDAEQALRMVAAGECAAALHDSFGLRQANLLPAIDAAVSAGTLRALFQADTAWEHLDFNLSPASERTPIFADAALRRAAVACIDRQALADAIYPGHGVPALGLAPPGSPHALPEADAALYAFDPDRGRGALAEAGWTASGSGPAQKEGVALEVELIVQEGEPGQTLAGLIAGQLGACGFGVTPRFATPEEMTGIGAVSPIYQRDFDLALFAWRGGPGGEPQCHLYTSQEIPTEETNWQGANVTGYSNPAFDETCARALRAGPAQEALEAHRQAQRMLAADLPSLPLFHRLQWLAAQPAVSGLGLDGIASDDLRSELIDVELLGYGG